MHNLNFRPVVQSQEAALEAAEATRKALEAKVCKCLLESSYSCVADTQGQRLCDVQEMESNVARYGCDSGELHILARG